MRAMKRETCVQIPAQPQNSLVTLSQSLSVSLTGKGGGGGGELYLAFNIPKYTSVGAP